jgi:hypothetical protein
LVLGNKGTGFAYDRVYLKMRFSFRPVTWFSFEMHNGRDINKIALRCIDEALGKTMDKISSEPPPDAAPHSRVFHDLIRSVLNCIQESTTQSRLTVFIEGCCFPHFGQGFRVKD